MKCPKHGTALNYCSACSDARVAELESLVKIRGVAVENLQAMNQRQSDCVLAALSALEKMHDLVDSACHEAKYFGPRSNSNDGKSLSLVLGDIRARADALSESGDGRNEFHPTERSTSGVTTVVSECCHCRAASGGRCWQHREAPAQQELPDSVSPPETCPTYCRRVNRCECVAPVSAEAVAKVAIPGGSPEQISKAAAIIEELRRLNGGSSG